MMPLHYALSDAAIVVAAVWAGLTLHHHGRRLPALAMLCFALPAAIGVARITNGWHAELASLHIGASQWLGLAGVLTLAVACLARAADRHGLILFGLILTGAAAIFLLVPALLSPVFILALAVALISTWWRPFPARGWPLLPAGFALMLANALLIRRAPWLDAAMAWHGYHLLIALALVLLAKGMTPPSAPVPTSAT